MTAAVTWGAQVPAPPTDVIAEQGLLGGILDAAGAGPTGVAKAAELATTLLSPRVCPPAALWRPTHEMIAQRMLAMVEDRQPLDMMTVMLELAQHGEITRVGGGPYLQDLLHAGYMGNPDRYAVHLRDLWLRRRAMERNVRALDMLANPEMEYGLGLAEMAMGLDDAEAATASARPIVARTVGDLLADLNDEPDWLIRGLLARLERVVLTGSEGLGKSELLIQLAVCAAFGLNPFTGERLGSGVRVLHVDVENERDDMRPRYRRVVNIAERHAQAGLDPDGLMFEDRTDGLELALPASDDLAWLDRLMLSARPDLLVIGPIYKLTGEDIEKATVAKALTANLDRLRVRHQCTLLMEAHMGNATDQATGHRIMRPQGSALFRRWPNVGLGLRSHWTVTDTDARPWLAEVVKWRGNRTARSWPRAVRVGKSGGMPWIGVDDMELMSIEEEARARKPRRTNTRKAG